MLAALSVQTLKNLPGRICDCNSYRTPPLPAMTVRDGGRGDDSGGGG